MKRLMGVLPPIFWSEEGGSVSPTRNILMPRTLQEEKSALQGREKKNSGSHLPQALTNGAVNANPFWGAFMSPKSGYNTDRALTLC